MRTISARQYSATFILCFLPALCSFRQKGDEFLRNTPQQSQQHFPISYKVLQCLGIIRSLLLLTIIGRLNLLILCRMDRYRNLTSRIDEIVSAIKSYNREAMFEIRKSKLRLPSIKLQTKNLRPAKAIDHVDAQFFDAFSLFCDKRVLPTCHSQRKQNPKKTTEIDSSELAEKKLISSSNDPYKLDNMLSLKINRILDRENIQRSKSTKLITNRSSRIALSERLLNRAPQDHRQEKPNVSNSLKLLNSHQDGKKYLNKRAQTQITRMSKNKTCAGEKQQELTGWDID